MNQKEDMREMIRREIQSISAIEERVAFKNLMEEVFSHYMIQMNKCILIWRKDLQDN